MVLFEYLRGEGEDYYYEQQNRPELVLMFLARWHLLPKLMDDIVSGDDLLCCCCQMVFEGEYSVIRYPGMLVMDCDSTITFTL